MSKDLLNIRCTINGAELVALSMEDIQMIKGVAKSTHSMELWIYSNGDSMMCMLKNGLKSWLMYLREEGDHGFHSFNCDENDGATKFILSNAQVDEFPNVWCIPIDLCLDAIDEFVFNNSELPKCVVWLESE